MVTIFVHFGALAHFGAPHVQPHDASMTGSDLYPVSSVCLIQKRTIFVTQDKFKKQGQIQNTLLSHAMETILLHFGPFWRILVHLMCDPMTPP